MKCLILAAGYATRLYPLTENFPKPLLKVRDKTILDWLVDDIDTLGQIDRHSGKCVGEHSKKRAYEHIDMCVGNRSEKCKGDHSGKGIKEQSIQSVDEYVVISNHKYAHHFQQWADTKPMKITVVDDGTDTNETRLGAVRDIQFAIDQGNIDDEMLVIAGDNVLDFSLTRFIAYAKEKGTSCIMRYYECAVEKLRKCGVVVVDDNDRILDMTEKPSEPKSNWCCPPFYFYTKEDAKLIKKGIDSGCGVDAPGSYMAWLCTQTPVHAMEMPGKRYDIGNLQSYEQVQKEYQGIAGA